MIASTLCGLRNLRPFGTLIAVALALSAPIGSSAAHRSQGADEPHAPNRWQDLRGRVYTLQSEPAIKARVFVFASTQCPISNLYIPRINELDSAYSHRGARFFLVDSNPEDTAARLSDYARERRIEIPVVKDHGTALADALAADRTPEAIVVDQKGAVVYRGRIDDNVDRTRIVRHDLAEALDSILSGRPIAHPRTIAFGCGIYRDHAEVESHAAKAACVYTRDIAPILNSHCVGCHRAGEVAPFALETYAEARTWARAIQDVTTRRIMPPWKAVPGFGEFCDARGLDAHDIAAIASWAAAGAPQGDVSTSPPAPHFPPAGAWSLGKPDCELQPVRPYHLTAEGPDVYRNFVLPIDFKEDRYVSAMEFKPGNRAVVHHVVLYIDPTAQSAKMDGKETEPGYSVPGVTIGVFAAEWGEVWVPGRTPRFFPPGVAVKIPAGSKLVMQVHYHKNGAPQTDSTRLALYFAHDTVKQILQTGPLLNAGFALQPGNAHQQVTTSVVLPMDVHIRTVFPHMHLLGREMKVTATLPTGETKPLIYVKDWDFNWQETYLLREPMALPKGTRIDVAAVFDNSDRNPRQPSHPPHEVHWGEQTTDEMCLAVLGFTIDNQKLSIQPIASH